MIYTKFLKKYPEAVLTAPLPGDAKSHKIMINTKFVLKNMQPLVVEHHVQNFGISFYFI